MLRGSRRGSCGSSSGEQLALQGGARRASRAIRGAGMNDARTRESSRTKAPARAPRREEFSEIDESST